MATTTWFKRGVLAFQNARPGAPACYPCPMCLQGFDNADDLSPDHFPPQSRGGKSAVLTCTKCNNLAGSELEADIEPAESIYDFVAGEMSEPRPGHFEFDGHALNADIQATDDAFLVFGVPGANDPAIEQALKDFFDKLGREGTPTDFEMRLSFGTHRREDALASWLRSAYLAVFSAWGYRYNADI